MATCNAAVLDLGGVLIDWDPRHLYRKLLPTEAAVDEFLATVCTPEWNRYQDAGRALDDGIAELAERFPDQVDLIRAWKDRFAEMMYPIPESVDLLGELRERGIPTYALSNWNAQTFEDTRDLFPFLEWFHGIFISGRVGVVKPDPQIFKLFLKEYDLEAGELMFVDDQAPNVDAARHIGFDAVLFTSPRNVRVQLERVGLL